jgi:hypothetical protein
MMRSKIGQTSVMIVKKGRGRHNDGVRPFAREGREGVIEIALAGNLRNDER